MPVNLEMGKQGEKANKNVEREANRAKHRQLPNLSGEYIEISCTILPTFLNV